jgi:RNA polymerase sigma-70 factor (ECF subfamily)
MRGLLIARSPTPASPAAVAPPDEDAWAVAAAKADPPAFAPLYARYFDSVYRYCYRRLGHPEAAADATGQVFVKALAALSSCRDDAPSFRSWLFAIAHNVLVDEARACRLTFTLEAAADVAAANPSLEEEVLSAEVGRTVRRLLAQLSPDQQQVMELRLAGLTGPEIADAVGRSLGSVKIAQVRAFARLRAALGLAAARSPDFEMTAASVRTPSAPRATEMVYRCATSLRSSFICAEDLRHAAGIARLRRASIHIVGGRKRPLAGRVRAADSADPIRRSRTGARHGARPARSTGGPASDVDWAGRGRQNAARPTRRGPGDCGIPRRRGVRCLGADWRSRASPGGDRASPGGPRGDRTARA